LDSGIAPVGVFVNESIPNILALLKAGVIDIVQLHGNESEDYIRRLKSQTDSPIIKAVGAKDTYPSKSADFLLFDSPAPGSGRCFDWNTIPQTDKPFFLAGGLNPDNVVNAVKAVNPFAVDVSSGVEVDGVKDCCEIRRFVERLL